MSTDDDRPLFACRCLNIRLCSGERISQDQPSDASTEYLPLFVADDGIKISHNELTLRARSPVVNDSTSATGRAQQTLVTCLVCETAAYRVKAEVQLDEDAKEGPILPTEDWAERDTLRSKSGFVDVYVGKGGCIGEDEIKRVMSSASYSQYFAINVPSEAHLTSTTAPPILPQARLTIPVEHSFLPPLPPFLPPPPFTPSHPIFLHLSSVVTAHANDARRDAEKRIEEFARQELSLQEEHETALRTQLEHLWWIVKERLKKAEEERDANLLLALQSRRRSMSPRRVPSDVSPSIDPVVRNFVPSTYHAPRTVHVAAARPSALSASLATTSFHHPRARQEAGVGRSNTSAVSGEQTALTPSPLQYPSNPSSSGSSASGTGSVASLSRSFKRNMDASNDIAVTYRYFVIEEQEAERRKARERVKDNEVGINGTKQASTRTTSNLDGDHASNETSKVEEEKKSPPAEDRNTSPKKKTGRRKVTFNVEPNIVTIKREVTAEAKEERVPERGEDLLFDMDGVDIIHHKNETPIEGAPDGEKVDIIFHEAPEHPTRSTRRHDNLKDAGLPQSFAALRPSSLPAPSNIRPPLPGRSEDERNSQSGASSTATNPDSSNRKDVNSQISEGTASREVLSPEQKDFLKLVAADTPSHRGLWKPGSNAWKIFDRNVRRSPGSAAEDEDEEGDDLESPNTSRTESTGMDWRTYRRPDIIGSLPIPMAPISQHNLSGVPSLQPKTSLADRRGALVPPLPAVIEEDEGREKKSPAVIRKEVYTERNKARGLDPGVLDFVDDDDNDTESPDQESIIDQVSTSRSRQQALKILRARNSVPPEGFWRSLAT